MNKSLIRPFYIASILAILLAQIGQQPVFAAVSFTVNSTADLGDANIGNGSCETSTPGQCTLRAAIQETNALPGADTITVPAGTYLLSGNGQLHITDGVAINGADAATTIVDGGGLNRVFNIHTVPYPVQISNLTVEGVHHSAFDISIQTYHIIKT